MDRVGYWLGREQNRWLIVILAYRHHLLFHGRSGTRKDNRLADAGKSKKLVPHLFEHFFSFCIWFLACKASKRDM